MSRRKVAWPPWLPQRVKLYSIEDNDLGYGGFYSTVEAAQGVIDRMLATDWYQERSPVRFVRAVYPLYGMSGGRRVDRTHWKIEFYASRMCERSLFHEMVHPLVWCRKGDTPADHEWDHGPEFCGALLLLYRRFQRATEAEVLQRLFDERGVRWWPEDRIRWMATR